jgi:hypothetical protein
MLVVTVIGPALVAAAERRREAGSPTPFTSTRPGEVAVPARVGALGLRRFLVDTGSTHTAITAALALALGAPPVAQTTMRASGGTLACVVVALPLVGVGIATVDGLMATVLPPQAAGALGPGIDGVLGQDFLSRFRFTIDYGHSRIVWHEATYVPTGERLTLVPSDDRWLVELPPRAGAPAYHFVPDSGADTLVLYGQTVADRVVTEWRGGPAALGSLTGTRTLRAGIVDRLQVGAASVDRQPAVVFPERSAGDVDGLLPLHVFDRVFFNAAERYLVVQR